MSEALKKFKLDISFYFAELLNKPLVTPHHIYLDLTHHCTHKCVMCGVIHILKNKIMPLKYVKKAIDEIKTWDRENTILTLTGGEPLTREDIFEIINYATSSGIRTELITNGYLINQAVAEKLMHSRLENIAVSLEGAKAETHESITCVKGSFNKAIESIKMMLMAKKAYGSGPQISVWMTIMERNIEEICALAKLSKKLGVECLVYHPVIVKPTDMQNTIDKGEVWPNLNELSHLRKEINNLLVYKKKYGIIAFLHDPWLFVDYFKGGIVKREWKCNPFEFLSIGPDGNMQICGDSFGNIGHSSIMDAMKNERAAEVRQQMKLCTKNCFQTCWARPDSDSIQFIISNFLSKIEELPKEKQRVLLQEALKVINDYKGMIRWES